MSADIGAARYAHLLGGNGLAERYLRRSEVANSKDYSAFIELLYEDLDSIIKDFQANPQRRSKDSEDRLTEEMVGYLNTSGYSAYHGTSSGGHVDLTVMLGRELTWIGEAKKDQKFHEGFLQLSTRYRPAGGDFSHNQAGMILYCCKPPDLLSRRTSWIKKVSGMAQFKELTAYDCPKNRYMFYTKHIHEVTGEDFIVRHMFVGLIWEPKDASARGAKARAAENSKLKSTIGTKVLQVSAKGKAPVSAAAAKTEHTATVNREKGSKIPIK